MPVMQSIEIDGKWHLPNFNDRGVTWCGLPVTHWETIGSNRIEKSLPNPTMRDVCPICWKSEMSYPIPKE